MSLVEADSPNENLPSRSGGTLPLTVALVGNPNAGKTTLFNRLTGLRAQTANFPGTTVERRHARIPLGERPGDIIDLPGLYSLDAITPDERVACAALRGELAGQPAPDGVVLVLDATNLQRNLYLAGEVLELGLPTVAAVNMIDVVEKHGWEIDLDSLADRLGCPVAAVSARTGQGVDALQAMVAEAVVAGRRPQLQQQLSDCGSCSGCHYSARYNWAEAVGASAIRGDAEAHGQLTEAIDRVVTRRGVGLLCFAAVMLLTFALIFWVAQYPMEWIDGLFGLASSTIGQWLPEGDLRSLLTDGLIGGVGGMLVFLPQICLLFFVLALLEDSGYLARAAFVMDRLMFRVGLPGKAFVPLLSAHACAIPAVMSGRVIEDRRDRLTTILVIPLMTCSARIPVYALVIALMFPDRPVVASLLFTGAYALGIVAAMATAWLLKKTLLPGQTKPLVIELPNYRLPSLRNALLVMWDRATVFVKSVGTTILAISLVMWALATYPKTSVEEMAPEVRSQIAALAEAGDDAAADRLVAQVQLENSLAGRMGRAIEPAFAPLGYDWKMSVGIVSSFAAREVIVSTLAVLYGVGDEDSEGSSGALTQRLRASKHADGSEVFTPATCLSLLVFYSLAMQCLPTQAVMRRETGGWKWPLIQLGYMSAIAYLAALVTYQTASLWL